MRREIQGVCVKTWEKIVGMAAASAVLVMVAYLYELPLIYLAYGAAVLGGVYVVNEFVFPRIPRKEPMLDAWEFFQKWWKNDMHTGEELTYEEGKGRMGYFGKERIYGFSVIRPGKERELIGVVSSKDKSIMAWDDVPLESNIGPWDVFRREYGVRPTPSPEINIEQHVDFYGRRRVMRKKVEKTAGDKVKETDEGESVG
jgi:hypothetical protein